MYDSRIESAAAPTECLLIKHLPFNTFYQSNLQNSNYFLAKISAENMQIPSEPLTAQPLIF